MSLDCGWKSEFLKSYSRTDRENMQTSSEMKSGDFNLLFLGYLDGPLESKIRDLIRFDEL